MFNRRNHAVADREGSRIQPFDLPPEPPLTDETPVEPSAVAETPTVETAPATVESIPDPALSKGKRTPRANKKKDTIVCRPHGIFFEHIDHPLGEIRVFDDPGFLGLGEWLPGIFGKKMFVHVMYQDTDGTLKAYTPPDDINNLPSELFTAVKGCESFSKLLAYKARLLEKIQVAMLFGIVAMLAFIIFLMVSK